MESVVTYLRKVDPEAARRAGERYACFGDLATEGQRLLFADDTLRRALVDPHLERAIGVIYLPETERASHYFKARITEQFDALLHVDTTTALRPLEPWSSREADLPETFPTGV
jgi:erythromycin esterase-like protein